MKEKSAITLDMMILGFLAFKDMTGYELLKEINCPVKAFWHAEHPQIYNTLKNLSDKALIEISGMAPGRNLEKKTYRITRKGMDSLNLFLKDSLFPEHGLRDPVMVHLFLIGNLPLAEQLRIYKEYYLAFKEQENEAARKYSTVSNAKPHAEKNPAERFRHEAVRRVYQFSVMRRQMIVTWLDACISDLEKEVKLESIGV